VFGTRALIRNMWHDSPERKKKRWRQRENVQLSSRNMKKRRRGLHE